MSDPQNTHGTPGANEEADTASGGAPDEPTPDETSPAEEEVLEEETTDDEGRPLENPSGG